MKAMISLLLHNIRSIHNVGSILRTAEGFGVNEVIFSGHTPYPSLPTDKRLPHIAARQTAALHKTALGAEKSVTMDHFAEAAQAIATYRRRGYQIVGLEQDEQALPLASYQPPSKLLLIVGEEVDGINATLRQACDTLLEIPMYGAKESFNVSVATGIALYVLKTSGKQA